MGRTRLIDINGNAGTFTPVYATQVTRRLEILEDYGADAGVGQGLAYQFDDGQTPNFTTIYEIAAQTEPIILGPPIPQQHGYGLVLGQPEQQSGGYSIPATLLINLRSASTTATVVRVTEFD